MKKLNANSDNGYSIAQDDYAYYITIANGKEYRHYEYDKACGTLEKVEKELQENSYNTIVKLYKDQYVYLDCIEPIC